MLKYTKYLLSSISRKKAPYIIISIFFILFDLTTWIVTKQTNEYFKSNINSLSTFDKFFPFLFSTLFIAMIVIYAFKKGESDGSELMVVAKPISRLQIILGKFFVLYIYIISFSALSSINYLLIGLTDKYANISDKINFALSLGVGGFIVLIIISSILVILASVLNRTSLLSFGVVLSAIIPILSFTISPIGKGQPFGYNFTSSNVNKLKMSELKNIKMESQEINLKDLSSIFDPETIYIEPSVIYEADYQKYKKEIWYQNIAFADIWYQWGRFYSIFQDHAKTPAMISDWERKTKLITANDQDTLKINDVNKSQYVLFVKQSELLNANVYLPLLGKISAYIKKHKSDFDNLSLFDRLNFIESVLKEYNVNPQIDLDSKAIPFQTTSANEFEQKLTYASSISATIYALLVELDQNSQLNGLNIFDKPKSAYPKLITINTNKDGIDTYKLRPGSEDKILLSPRMARVNSKIYVYEGKDFINSNTIIIIWLSFALIFLSGAIVSFMRRDFK